MKLICTLFIICCNVAFAQKSESIISFVPTFNNTFLEIDKNYPFKNDSLKITTLKFYISNIKFYNNDVVVDSVVKKYHLINFENPSTAIIKFTKSTDMLCNSISFNIGIDSLTNVGGAMGDDLDPLNGMYWTWQSGYINLKIEGKTSICLSRNNLFTFHIGGYQYPNNALQNVRFAINDNQHLAFNINISKLLSDVPLAEIYNVMSPNNKAVTIANTFSNVIKLME